MRRRRLGVAFPEGPMRNRAFSVYTVFGAIGTLVALSGLRSRRDPGVTPAAGPAEGAPVREFAKDSTAA